MAQFILGVIEIQAMKNTTETSKLSVVAVFDFDGTLTVGDSFLPFLRLAVGQWEFWWGLLVMSPVLLGYALKFIPNWQAKEALLAYLLADFTEEKLQRVAERFAVQHIPNLLRSEALDRLRWHQKQGHKTLLISASLEAYILPWAKTMGFDRASGTQLEFHNGLLTGRILGKNCYGSEKIQRLQELLGDLKQYCIYAYGDSRGDRELLSVATYRYYRRFHDTPE